MYSFETTKFEWVSSEGIFPEGLLRKQDGCDEFAAARRCDWALGPSTRIQLVVGAASAAPRRGHLPPCWSKKGREEKRASSVTVTRTVSSTLVGRRDKSNHKPRRRLSLIEMITAAPFSLPTTCKGATILFPRVFPRFSIKDLYFGDLSCFHRLSSFHFRFILFLTGVIVSTNVFTAFLSINSFVLTPFIEAAVITQSTSVIPRSFS